MSKLNGYSEGDKKLVVNLMQLFVHAKMERNELPEDEEVIKAEMPKTFDASKIFVDTVNHELARYSNFDPTDVERIRVISARMFQGAILTNEITHDMKIEEVEKLSKELLRGSVQTVNAVAEYLCG
jgi:hypothetical protein